TVSAADGHALLHGFFETAEASQSRGLRCRGGHAILNIFTLEHLDMKVQLILNLEHNLLAVRNSQQFGQDGFHDYVACKILATALETRFQLARSASSFLCPVLVSL